MNLSDRCRPGCLPPRSRVVVCAVALILSGCAEVPDLDGRISAAAAAAPYPTLQPLAPMLVQAAAPARVTPATTAAVDGDAAALRARAAALRGPVVDADTRARMAGGVDTTATVDAGADPTEDRSGDETPDAAADTPLGAAQPALR
ncbi:hypothetical protein [Loktanella fryxellensis]|nr:hypothetical protein [Loktanella fryxellensis]